MKNHFIMATVASGLALAALGAGGVAAAAPTGPSRVEDTVRTLEASGYNVIVNKAGAAPLSSCSITGVRQGQTHSTIDSRGSGSPNETITAKTVYVDVAC
jgi:hypothetical protein